MMESRLVELIKAWEKFLAAHPLGSVEAFASWVLSNSSQPIFNGNDPEFDKFQGRQKTSMQGAYLISKMSQYVTYYTKPMMRKFGLHSLDDFGYLQNIRYYKNITRTKACELMLQELTTGTDIIKRLIRNDFITEVLSAEDKRQKLLSLNQKGQKVLDNMILEFQALPDTLGDLSDEERSTILSWLNQLDVFHDDIVKNKRSHLM